MTEAKYAYQCIKKLLIIIYKTSIYFLLNIINLCVSFYFNNKYEGQHLKRPNVKKLHFFHFFKDDHRCFGTILTVHHF